MDITTISNANVLVDSFKKAKKGVTWKGSVQSYDIHLLQNVYNTKKKLETKSYKAGDFVEFPLHERGKTRWIKSMHVRDRVVQRAVCDEVLLPLTQKYYIYDNSASLRDKGLDFAIDRVAGHLHQFYRDYGTNEGYVILVDFTKYFDNIQHSLLIPMLLKEIEDKDLKELLVYLISLFEIEIGFLPKELQDKYEHGIFNSLEYAAWKHEHPEAVNGRYKSKKMKKSVGVGSQISQIAGIYFPTYIDNYFKIVRRVKGYERYMDDTFMLAKTLEEANSLLEDMFRLADQFGIYINKKKAQIIKLTSSFTFLKIKHHLTETGKLYRKVCQDTVVRGRRKMKKLKGRVDDGTLTYEAAYFSFQSVRGRLQKYNNYWSIQNLNKLHDELFIDDWHDVKIHDLAERSN